MYHQDVVMILPPLSHKLTYFLYQAVKKGGYTANLGTTLFLQLLKLFGKKNVDEAQLFENN